MREPISVYTAGAYPLAGLATWLMRGDQLSVVFAAAMVMLGLASAWFHWRPNGTSTGADHAAMNATLAVLATAAVGAPLWLVATSAVLAAGVVELWLDRPNRMFVAGMGWVGFCAALGRGEVVLAVGGLMAIGVAFALWQTKRDAMHGAWHVLTAIGLTVLWLGAVP